MSKYVMLSLVYCGLLFSSSVNAEQVKYPIPDKVDSCDGHQESRISSSVDDRNLAFVSQGFWTGFRFYDLAEKCTVKLAPTCAPMCAPGVNYKEYLKFAEPGDLFSGTILTASGRDLCMCSMSMLISETSSDYKQWLAELPERQRVNQERQRVNQEKAEKEAKAKHQEEEIRMPRPFYESSDSVLHVVFNSRKSMDNLVVTNQGTDFVKILSISTYYNNEINAISNLNIELPPQTEKYAASSGTLFSNDMYQFKSKRKNIEIAKQGITKFGFAIKYEINGAQKAFYSVKQYNNSELLQGMK